MNETPLRAIATALNHRLDEDLAIYCAARLPRPASSIRRQLEAVSTFLGWCAAQGEPETARHATGEDDAGAQAPTSGGDACD